jgi:hypothetical protein
MNLDDEDMRYVDHDGVSANCPFVVADAILGNLHVTAPLAHRSDWPVFYARHVSRQSRDCMRGEES